MAKVTAIPVSGLTRVFHDFRGAGRFEGGSVFIDDIFSFQIACLLDVDAEKHTAFNEWAHVTVASKLAECVTVRAVKLVPSAYPAPPVLDEGYERTAPGLYPDRLEKLGNGRFRLVAGQWRSLWVDVEPRSDTPPGTHDILISAAGEDGEELFQVSVSVTVYRGTLPESTLYHTEWFHADCLADYYRVPVFSGEHFEICENFIKAAVRRGVNTILTPLFTPPLDTAEGGFRTKVQLVEVEPLKNGQYRFDFSRLHRWAGILKRAGVTYIEMPHLFSQWGAKYAPAIYAGDGTRLFGWHTPGDSAEYAGFLRCFLPALKAELTDMGVYGRCLFHVSDEPELKDLKRYQYAKGLVKELLPDATFIDALSDFEFFKTGAVECPVVAIDHMKLFLDAGVPELWTYYCCAQIKDVTNRFFSMPLARCRALGVQLYKYNIKGFLHWSYNFYNSLLSGRTLNPYAETDAGEGFPSGDAFLVYPGADQKPEESLRIMVVQQAFHDCRALRWLESLTGREQVLPMLKEVTLTKYPLSEAWYLQLREQVNKRIAESCEKRGLS